MQKAYSKTVWENYPSDNTPINEANLNKIETGVDEIDNRVIALDTTKFDKTEAAGLIKSFELDNTTGIITVTNYNGSITTIDTLLEKIAVNFDFDSTTQKLVITLDDGTTKEIDLSAFITVYEFLDSDTIAFTVDSAGKVTAIVKEGSIEEKHLQPNYLADIKTEVAKAEASKTAAAQSEANAKTSEDNAKISEDNAKTSETNAAFSASIATEKAEEAANSATGAAGSADIATQKAEEAEESANASKTSEDNAKASENNAETSASIATEKATIATESSTKAESYAVGGTGTRDGEDTDNAKYYKEQAQLIVGGIEGGFVPMGTITFEQLASQTVKVGYMYNISDDFTSDETFKDGAGIDYPAGTNVYRTADGMWDCLTGSSVFGVKGNKETAYRKGMVNITPENIGAADNIYYDKDNDKLQLRCGTNVLSEIEFGGGIKLAQPTGVSLTNADEEVIIKWTDPADLILDGVTLAKWDGTLIVRKAGSAPTSKTDGVIVVDSKTRDSYKSTGFSDTGLTNGTKYYYGVFPYTSEGSYTYDYTTSITPAAIYPSAATGVSVEAGNAQATITFTKPSDASYARIVYKSGSAPSSPTDGTSTSNVTSPYTLTGLTNNTTYYAKVFTYNAKGRYTASSSVNFTPKALTIVTFASGSDADIAKMLEQHYAGQINISDYWAVGDKRNISLNGTNYEFVIMDFDHYDLTTSINGKSKAAVVIGMVDCFGTKYPMNSSNTNSGGWTSSTMRQTTMSTMKGYLPTAIQNLAKQVKTKTSAGNQSTTINTDNDYCFLPSEIEVFGTTTYSVSGEGTQLEYYKTSSNRIKKYSGSSAFSFWLLRSPYSGGATIFCIVDRNGGASNASAGTSNGLSFCLCI